MQFTAYKRSAQGTGASRRLRHAGRTPGILYGGKSAPVTLELDHKDLWFALKKEAFHASILNMSLDGKAQQVLLRDVQMHPFKPLVLHVDFQRVEADTRLSMKVPLHYKGEENSPAVKLDQCLINHVVNELEISCLPADLPKFIEIDLSNLKKGSSLHLADINLPKGVTAAKHGQQNPVLVAVTSPVEESEETPAPEAAAPAAKTADAKASAAKAPAAKK